MLATIPFHPLKGEVFRAYFSLEGIEDRDGSNRGIVWRNGSIAGASWKISKDGGAVADLTNAPVAVHNSLGYVDLTAAEMDADVVLISGSIYSQPGGTSDSIGYIATLIIYTSGSAPAGSGGSAGLALTDTVSDINSAPEKDPTIRDVLSFLYQYFRKRRKRKEWSFRRHIERG